MVGAKNYLLLLISFLVYPSIYCKYCYLGVDFLKRTIHNSKLLKNILVTARTIPPKLQSDPSSVQKHATAVNPHTGHVPRMGFLHRSIKFGMPAVFIATIPATRPSIAPYESQMYVAIAAPIALMVSLYDQSHLPRTSKANVTLTAPRVHAPGNHPGFPLARVVTRSKESRIVHISQLAGVDAGTLRVHILRANIIRVLKATKPPRYVKNSFKATSKISFRLNFKPNLGHRNSLTSLSYFNMKVNNCLGGSVFPCKKETRDHISNISACYIVTIYASFTLDMRGIEFRIAKHTNPSKPDVVEVFLNGTFIACIYADEHHRSSIKVVSRHLPSSDCVRFEDGTGNIPPVPSIKIDFLTGSQN